jgi:hypothetical protein
MPAFAQTKWPSRAHFFAEELVKPLGFRCRTKITSGAGPATCRSDEAVQLAIRHIIEWLPNRKGAKDDLCLPKDAKLVMPK